MSIELHDVHLILELLEDLLEDSSFTPDTKDQYVQLFYELKHLELYLQVRISRLVSGELVLESQLSSALDRAGEEYEHQLSQENYLNGFQSCDSVTSELLKTIQLCKIEIKAHTFNYIDRSLELNFSIVNLQRFMKSILISLQDLLDWDAGMILDVKVKIESLKRNLDWLIKFFSVTRREEDFKDLKIHTQALVSRATCVPLLYWVLEVKKEDFGPRMDIVLSDLQKKTSPSNPEVTRMYIEGLKALHPSTEDSFDELVEVLGGILEGDPEKDAIRMLFNNLVLLIRLLMKHQEVEELDGGKLVLEQADAFSTEVASVIGLLCTGEAEDGIAEERNLLLHASLEKAKAIKAEVKKLYPYLFLDPPPFNFPKVNVVGFIDSLLENLEELSLHFQENQIKMLQEELLSLKESSLQDFSMVKLQNKHPEIEDLWTRITKMAYNAENAVNSFICMKKAFLWQDDILFLSDVIEEVKLIKGEAKRIQERHIYDIHTLNLERKWNSSALLSSQANNPTPNNIVVGFKNEANKLVDQLLWGSEKLHFISIFGMPGLGKTTLAKKVYNDASVQDHFHRCAWFTVSQQFNRKKILSDILRQTTAAREDNLFEMDEEDLADRVRKSLKGQRYFIVMDDVWDVNAWNALQMSFPDDENGSRIMLTSRIHNVVPRPESSLTSFPLNPLSDVESWELLSKKLFGQGSCPSDFIMTGRQIAKNCKGLPLSIVLIAGLLKEKVESLDWWKHVQESLDSLITREGCGDVVELSYQHLPEYLKPCFLYFGLFKEDEEIRVKKLIQLWVAESLIRKQDEIESVEVLGEEYLKDLVARSLVLVTKRSSTGGIKACSIHDLLRDFCMAKSEEENFCNVIRENNDWNMASSYAYYRVAIQAPECLSSFLNRVPPASAVSSLLTSPQEDFAAESEYIKNLRFPCFKFLHILGLHVYLSKFPEEITKLVHLRHLALYFGRRAVWLPPSIKRLKNLKTLYLQAKQLHGESNLMELQTLRHVYIPSCKFSSFLYNKLSPLVNIRTFSSVTVSSHFYIKELRNIPGVKKLRCVLDRWEAPILKLDFLSYLESLYVHSDHRCTLVSCKFQFPNTLKKLRLVDFDGLEWSEISPIANLPNLEVLKLSNSFSGKTWNVKDGEFLELKCLVLEFLDIQQLDASDDSFPCLERLEIDVCTKLRRISSTFGRLPTLKMIQVRGCRGISSSLREIQEEQQDMGNEDFEIHGINSFQIIQPQGMGNEDFEIYESNMYQTIRQLNMGNEDREIHENLHHQIFQSLERSLRSSKMRTDLE